MIDEDLELFLEEFGTLLNKYHYVARSFTLGKLKNSENFVGGFTYVDDVWHCDLVIIKKKDENET